MYKNIVLQNEIHKTFLSIRAYTIPIMERKLNFI